MLSTNVELIILLSIQLATAEKITNLCGVFCGRQTDSKWVRPNNIYFSPAMRPRLIRKQIEIPPTTIVPRCENCSVVWPK